MIELGRYDGGKIGFDLPTLVETRLLIQANSGGGKSWAIRRLLEQSHGRIQQIVLDLEGEFSTLRERYDYILAGHQGDTPADPKSAKLLARKLLELEVSAICDLYELKAHDRIRFVRYFLESMISSPRRLYHPVLVIVDEAHIFCPEKGQAESAGAIIDLATRGRKRGFCAVLATQRLSKLHKDACAELLNKMVGRASLDIDQKRAADELGIITKGDRIALRDYRPGEFSTYGPALRDHRGKTVGGVIKLMVGGVESRHPKVGSRKITSPPAPTAKIKKILGELADLPEQAEKEARDINTLRNENTQLKRQLTALKRENTDPAEMRELKSTVAAQQAKMRAVADNIKKRLPDLNQAAVSLSTSLNAFVEANRSLLERAMADIQNGTGQDTAPVVDRLQSRPRPRMITRAPVEGRTQKPADTDNQDITRPQRNILDALAAFESLGMNQVNKTILAVKVGVSPRSGGYFNNLGALRSRGLIDYPSANHTSLTEEGRSIAENVAPIATLDEFHDSWLRMVSGPQAKILAELVSIYPESLSKPELAERIGVSANSGGFFNNLGRLRSMGAIDYPAPNTVRATELLFPEVLA